MSWFFFILTPFGFFCAENGTGLITGTVFLILGFICKWIENGGLEPKIKVEPKDWWETNYRINMAQGRGHEASKGIADDTTRWNHCPMPSEEEKERIAKSLGVVTEKSKQDIREHWDRVQVGKYYLMTELIEKYEKYHWNVTKLYPLPVEYIKASRNALEFVWDGRVGGFLTFSRFKKNDEEMWNSLSTEEKNEAREWVREYEERFVKEINDYLENGVEMPTITKHYRCGKPYLYDFDIKYGFTRSMVI